VGTTSTTVRTAVPPGTTVSTRNRVGIVLATLLGLGDIGGLALVGRTLPQGEQGAPDVVLVIGAVLGMVTVVAAVLAWVKRSRGGLRVAAASRLLSVVLGIPAFLVDGVPDAVVALTAVSLVVTLVTVALLVSRR